ncbi:MAG: DUF5802 family protein [Haloferacaceae archaeon]
MVLHSMFEQFSSGYYLGRLYIEPHDGTRAALHAGEYREVRRQLYREAGCDPTGSDPTGTDPADLPLVMRYDSQHFVVDGEESVPERTLAVPGPWLDDYDPTEPREVFLAKADRANQLLQWAVGADDRNGAGDGDDGGDHGGGVGGDGGVRHPPGSPFVPSALGDVARPGRRHQ